MHATFVDSPSNGSHAPPPMAQPVAEPVACQCPGTVNTADANNLSKPHRDDSRGHAQARNEKPPSMWTFRASKPKGRYTTNTLCPSSTVTPTAFNSDFPAPARQQVATQRPRCALKPAGPDPHLVSEASGRGYAHRFLRSTPPYLSGLPAPAPGCGIPRTGAAPAAGAAPCAGADHMP